MSLEIYDPYIDASPFAKAVAACLLGFGETSLFQVGWNWDLDPSGKVFSRNTISPMKKHVIARHPSVPYIRVSKGRAEGFPLPKFC